MLEIKVTAVPPGQADGLSVAQQVDMALSGLGFRRDGVALPVGFSAPMPSIPSTDGSAEPCDDPSGDAQAEPVAPSKEAAAGDPAPRRRDRPRKDESPVPQPSETTTGPSASPSAEPFAAEAVGPADAPQISTNPEDRAEPEAEPKKLTHEDLRNALGRLSQKVGLATAVAEVRALVGGGIQDVPDTQDALGAVLAKMEARIAGGEPLMGAAPAQPDKTHDDVKAAIVEYAKRYGQDAAKVDWKTIAGFAGKVDDMPVDALGKAATAIADAVENNPFGRARADG